MCLAVPGKIVETHDAGGVRMAQVDFGGIRREACLEYLQQLDEYAGEMEQPKADREVP